METGRGNCKTLSQIACTTLERLLATGADGALSAQDAQDGRATPYFACLRNGDCLTTPAGWFLQLMVPAGSSGADMWVLERASACLGHKMRPTIMHLNATCSPADAAVEGQDLSPDDDEQDGSRTSSYTTFLRNKRRRKLAAEDLPRGEASSVAGLKMVADAPVGACRALGGEGAGAGAGADLEGGEEEGGENDCTCMWLKKGWSAELDLTRDWFSHNIPSWRSLFGGRGWLRACACCEGAARGSGGAHHGG